MLCAFIALVALKMICQIQATENRLVNVQQRHVRCITLGRTSKRRSNMTYLLWIHSLHEWQIEKTNEQTIELITQLTDSISLNQCDYIYKVAYQSY